MKLRQVMAEPNHSLFAFVLVAYRDASCWGSRAAHTVDSTESQKKRHCWNYPHYYLEDDSAQGAKHAHYVVDWDDSD